MENSDLMPDVKYFIDKRDVELERFNLKIKCGNSEEIIRNGFKSLMRIQRQLKLAEDALVIYNISKK